jgi:hypothetical protein
LVAVGKAASGGLHDPAEGPLAPGRSHEARPHIVTPGSSTADLTELDSTELSSLAAEDSVLSLEQETSRFDYSSHIDDVYLFLEDMSVSEASEEEGAAPYQNHSTRSPTLFLIKASTIATIALALLWSSVHRVSYFASPPSPVEKDSVYVAGGGFSGFWYALGRLDSIEDPSSKKYYCYSAGCLGVVSMLSNYGVEEVFDMAVNIQNQWKRGEISRFDVVGTFVDNLLYGPSNVCHKDDPNNVTFTLSSPLMDDPRLLSRLNIITTARSDSSWLRIQHSIRTPTSLENLRTMLIQTTWIPFAVGNGISHRGHLDGAFSYPLHHRYEHHVGLALDFDMLANFVNVKLGHQKVAKFWKKGLEQGL